jgi:hypothetical protein
MIVHLINPSHVSFGVVWPALRATNTPVVESKARRSSLVYPVTPGDLRMAARRKDPAQLERLEGLETHARVLHVQRIERMAAPAIPDGC